MAARGSVFESSEAKRWLLGGYQHGVFAGLPHPIATEMALGFRFTAERLPGVALAVDITTRLLEEVERFFDAEAATVRQGQLPDPAATRRRLEEILARAEEA